MILILESSASWCSVSLSDMQGKVVHHRLEKVNNSHAEKLPLFANELLALCDGNILAVAVSSGPGSYTGLRIGSSLAKGICYAKNIPLIAVSALRGMAAQVAENVGNDALIISHLDARRDEVYMQWFDSKLQALSDVKPYILSAGAFEEYNKKDLHIVGDCPSKFKSICAFTGQVFYHEMMPQSDFLAAEAAEKWIQNAFENTAYFEPSYLKEYQPGAHKKFTL